MGELTLSGEKAGNTFYLLVRSIRSFASGTLKVRYMTGPDTITDTGPGKAGKDSDGFAPTPVGPLSTKLFKAHALAMGGGGQAAKADTLSCCAGMD